MGLFELIHQYGTRALGVAAGTVTTLCGTGIIPEGQMKYWMAGLAVLTYWRGQSSSNAYNRGVVDGLTSPPVLTLPQGKP